MNTLLAENSKWWKGFVEQSGF